MFFFTVAPGGNNLMAICLTDFLGLATINMYYYYHRKQYFLTVPFKWVHPVGKNNLFVFVSVKFLQRQLKQLKDNLKKCLDKRSRLQKSGAAASSLPKCKFFDSMAFLHEKQVITRLKVILRSKQIIWNLHRKILTVTRKI